jgi:hypothetical protein
MEREFFVPAQKFLLPPELFPGMLDVDSNANLMVDSAVVGTLFFVDFSSPAK